MKLSVTVTGLVYAAAILLAGGMLYAFVPELWGAEMVRLLVAGGIATAAYRLLCPATKAGYFVILAAWTLLAVGFSLNLWWFTAANGGTVTEPVLANNDAFTLWEQLQGVVGGYETTHGIRLLGTASILNAVFLGAAPRVDNLMTLSVLCTLLAIVFTGGAAAGALEDADRRTRQRISVLAMGLMAAVCYFLASGVLIIKDALECMLMAVAAWATVGIVGKKNTAYAWPALIAVVALSRITRPYQLCFLGILFTMTAAFICRRHKWSAAALTVLVAGCGVLLYDSFVNVEAVSVLETSPGRTQFHIGDIDSSRLAAFNTITGNIYGLSLLQRLVKLPFFAAVQFFTPLPWAFARDTVFGPSQAWAHVSYPWYAVAGLFLFFLIFCLRRAPKLLVLMAIFYCMAFLATAYVTGGTVSRYCLPWLPFLTPCAAWTVVAGEWRRRTFRIYAICDAAAVAIGLAVIFKMLNIYSPGGWEAS